MIRSSLPRSLLVLVLCSQPALSKPPPEASPGLSPWFQSLADPETTLSCCEEADCHAVEDRVVRGHYEALVGGAWLPVPERKVIRRIDNPVGRAVLCWSPSFGVMCFVPGPAA
jgi:hypothetical protein